MATVGTLGLGSLAYGIGEMAGGGSAAAVGGSSSSSGTAPQGGAQFTADPAPARQRHPCPHMGSGSGTADPSQQTPPAATSY